MLQNEIAQRIGKYLGNSKAEGTIIPSAVYATTQTTSDITNNYCNGVVVTLDVTNVNTSSITLKIQCKDPASGKYRDVLTGAAVSTISTNVYKVYPGLTAVANATVNDVITNTFRIVVTAGNSNNTTYSVGYSTV